MPSNTLILDIRYFESDTPNVDGMSPDDVGYLLKFPMSSAITGARIARKLRELGFTTGDFSHVYINFSTAVAVGEIAIAKRSVDSYHPWFRYIDVGVDMAKINKLSVPGKQLWLESVTLQVCMFLAGKSKSQYEIVVTVRELLTAHGEALPIIHKTKDTTSYLVIVSYLIADEIHGSSVWVEYLDKKSGKRRRGAFVNLQFYDDVYFLVSSVSVRKGTIVFRPRTSFKAHLYNKRYKVPLSIPINELPVV